MGGVKSSAPVTKCNASKINAEYIIQFYKQTCVLKPDVSMPFKAGLSVSLTGARSPLETEDSEVSSPTGCSEAWKCPASNVLSPALLFFL